MQPSSSRSLVAVSTLAAVVVASALAAGAGRRMLDSVEAQFATQQRIVAQQAASLLEARAALLAGVLADALSVVDVAANDAALAGALWRKASSAVGRDLRGAIVLHEPEGTVVAVEGEPPDGMRDALLAHDHDIGDVDEPRLALCEICLEKLGWLSIAAPAPHGRVASLALPVESFTATALAPLVAADESRVEVRDEGGRLVYALGPERGAPDDVRADVAVNMAGLSLRLKATMPRAVVVREAAGALIALLSLGAFVVALVVAAGTAMVRRERAARAKDVMHLTALAHQERLAAVGAMSAALAHELRNVLQILSLHVGDLRDAVAAHARPALEEVDAASKALLGISDQLRMFSRRDAGGARLARAGDAVRASLQLLAPRLRHCHVDTADHAGAALVAGGALPQALHNLIANAVAAAPHGRIAVRVEQRGDRVVVGVEDDGPGVDPDAAERLFEPFFTTKGADEGTGLGLWISRELVRQSRGELRYCGRGSLGGARFEVELPLMSLPTAA